MTKRHADAPPICADRSGDGASCAANGDRSPSPHTPRRRGPGAHDTSKRDRQSPSQRSDGAPCTPNCEHRRASHGAKHDDSASGNGCDRTCHPQHEASNHSADRATDRTACRCEHSNGHQEQSADVACRPRHPTGDGRHESRREPGCRWDTPGDRDSRAFPRHDEGSERNGDDPGDDTEVVGDCGVCDRR